MKLTYVAYSALDLQSANSIQTLNTCRALSARLGPDLSVVVPRFGGHEPEVPFRAVKIPRIPLNKLSRVFRSAWWSYLERTVYSWLAVLHPAVRRADVVYCRDIVCAFWLITFGRPVVYEVHDLEARHPSMLKSARLSRWLERIDERTLRGARAVVSLTSTFREELAERGWQPRDRIAVIPDAFDDAVYFPRRAAPARARLGLPPGALVIGYAGLTFAYRRLDLLLEALRILNNPSVHALIIGGRSFEVQKLQRRAEQLGVQNSVLWRGRLSPDATAEELSAADILVIPDTVTEATASPLKMFEYMALGRAIVAVDRPALREVLAPGTADFFRPGDAEDFARALRELAASKPRREALAARALECARQYTYEARAERIIRAVR